MNKVEFMLSEAKYNVSQKLRTTMVQNVLNGEKAVLIVPDQFDFETEKAVYRAFGDKTHYFPNVQVTTFSKLADELISMYGTKNDRAAAANETTKTILMYRAINELDKPLEAFSKNAKKSGFAAKMYSTIAMLKNAGLSDKDFCQKIDAVKEDQRDNNKTLFAKLEDIKNIYNAFELQMSSFKYADALDRLKKGSDIAVKNGCFKGKSFYFDKFSDFSERQLDFIRTIIETADNVTLSFVTGKKHSREIFSTVDSTINCISDCAEASGKTVEGLDTFITEYLRDNISPSINELSDNLYGTPSENADMSDITIIKAEDVHNEADYIAAEIRRQCVLENKYNYKDIAVLCSSPSDYKAAIESSFERYEIPVFCDIPESILYLPLVNLVTSLLNALRSFTIENVLSYVKTGFLQKKVELEEENKANDQDNEQKFRNTGISMKEISDFESYVLIWGISSKDDLKTPFPVATNGNKDELFRRDNAELVRVNAIEPLIELSEKLSGKHNGSDITKMICEFLFEKVGIERAIMARCKKTGTSNDVFETDKETVASYQSLWGKVLEIFEALNAALGNCDADEDKKSDAPMISIDDYYHLFRDICTSTTLAQPPKVNDSVLVGDITRTKTESAKIVFVAGACYGLFPVEEQNKGIFSDYETELLGESIIKIAKNRMERYCYEKYQAYTALTSPSEKLYITYPMLDVSCKEMSPSEVITQLCDNYKMKIISTSEYDDEFFCSSKRAAQQKYAKRYNSDTEEKETLKAALTEAKCDDFTAKLDKIAELRKREYNHSIRPETAEALFNDKTFSATNIEKLNDCKFKYFCTKGLRVNSPYKKDLNATNVGLIIHFVLQKFLEKYCNNLDTFIRMTRLDMSKIVKDIMELYKKNELTDNSYFQSERFIYLYDTIIASAALDILSLLKAEFAARKYRPMFFELEISDNSTSATSVVTNKDQALNIADMSATELTITPPAPNDNANTQNSNTTTANTQSTPQAPLTLSSKPYIINLNNNITIKLTGNVDRIDTFKGTDGQTYMRVVDYKTGHRSFSIDKALFGVSNQMAIYLITLISQNSDIRPGGISYMPAMAGDVDDSKRESLPLLLQGHKQSGILISYPVDNSNDKDDNTTPKAIDETLEEATKYHDAMKAKGYNGRSPLYPDPLINKNYDSFAKECIDNTAASLQELYNGKINATPIVYKDSGEIKRPCKYCSFASICGYNINNELMIDMSLVDENYHPHKNQPPKTEEKKTAKKSKSSKKADGNN